MGNQNGLWTQVNVRCSGRGDGARERDRQSEGVCGCQWGPPRLKKIAIFFAPFSWFLEIDL